MTDQEIIDAINTHLPNRGYIMHGAPRLGDAVRSWPPSVAIDGGALTDPQGVRHENWSVGPHELGIVVHTDAGAQGIDTSKWLVHGVLKDLGSIRKVGQTPRTVLVLVPDL